VKVRSRRDVAGHLPSWKTQKINVETKIRNRDHRGEDEPKKSMEPKRGTTKWEKASKSENGGHNWELGVQPPDKLKGAGREADRKPNTAQQR